MSRYDTGNKLSVHAEGEVVTLTLHAKPSEREDADHFCFGPVDLTVTMTAEVAETLGRLIGQAVVAYTGAVELIAEHPEWARLASSPGTARLAIAAENALVFELYSDRALSSLAESLSVAAQTIYYRREHSGECGDDNAPSAASETLEGK